MSEAPVATRRRGDALEAAILDAAWAELAEVGYPRLTMEAVANRARTSKPVIYRRWPTRAELVVAAMRHKLPPFLERIDTGSIRTDLITLLERVAHRFDGVPNDTVPGLLAETFGNPAVMASLRTQIAATDVRGYMTAMLERAVERGELPTAYISTRLARLPFDLMRSEVLIHGTPLKPEVFAEIIDDIVLPAMRAAN
ncbi:TetR/AcrR family transcriptional regulator [Fodinicola acaciae]|uniref:TetR/AcrR family transcriptional regulator n=1 Tax=Fodinicola acaciae TaxID=2681555 RepID=UPI0013D77450|nr:TetR/AcrR family transcriptional regulator [Fodinicola acaciae]